MVRICALRFTAAAIFLMGLPAISFARAPEDAEFRAAAALGEEISEWVADDLGDKKPGSMAIFSVYSNPPLEKDYSAIVETEILKGLADQGMDRVSSCAECRMPIVSVQGDHVVVSKGATDLMTLRKIGEKIPVESFMVVDIYRTKLSILAQVVLYKNPTAEIIAAQRFSVPAVNINESSVQIMIMAAAGKASSDFNTAAAKNSGLSLGANLLLLEELGFAKGGLNLGGVFGGDNGSLFYLNPTLAFRGRVGRTAVSWALQLGLGYGIAPEAKGFTLRAAYEVFLGSITAVGLEGVFFIPQSGGANVQTFRSFIGANIGISFGR